MATIKYDSSKYINILLFLSLSLLVLLFGIVVLLGAGGAEYSEMVA
jgi:hypothetical protein